MPQQMTPEQAIAKLPALMGQINRFRAAVDNEQAEIQEQWAQLGRFGGQRADHAAQMLSRLRPALTELASFCQTCEQQIGEFVADPFGRKGD
jgi:hypothetical protein